MDIGYDGGRENNSFVGKPTASVHKFYLSGEIGNPESYISWFETIRNAGENDMIYIHINSEGGNLFTAIQFLRILGETRGTVVASVEGLCMSAATIIFMAAKHHQITEHSIFMFHNYSTTVNGKGGEMFDQIVHFRNWGEIMMRDVYNDFLTNEEIASILEGKDMYMMTKDVASRLEKRNEALIKKMETEKNPDALPKKVKKPRKIIVSHRDKVAV